MEGLNDKYLYIIHFIDALGFNYCKIGISYDPEQRIKSLQGKIDYEIKIIYKKYLKSARSFEEDLKKRFCKRNVKYYLFGKVKLVKRLLPNNTEWFHLEYEQVKEVVNELDKYDFKKKKEKINVVKSELNVKENKTYFYKKKRKGKDYYQLSSIQYQYIMSLVNKKRTNLTEARFLKDMCKRFQLNKMLTEKQYKYTKLLAYKYQ